MADNAYVRLVGGDELIAALKRVGVNVRGELRAAGQAGAKEIQERANAAAPGPHVETHVEQSSGSMVTVSIGPDKEHWYYRFAEYGAQAHEITGGPLLAFEGDQGVVITASVDHPGRAAAPFLRPALDEGADEATDALGARLRRTIEEVRA